MKYKKKKKWMENICDEKKFLFFYDGIADINPNSGHKIGEF